MRAFWKVAWFRCRSRHGYLKLFGSKLVRIFTVKTKMRSAVSFHRKLYTTQRLCPSLGDSIEPDLCPDHTNSYVNTCS